jgi:predicted dehydrogenase
MAKVVVIGAGAWGKNHVRTFHELGALAGVVELSPVLREKVQADFPGVTVWDNLADALPHADGVVIATPAPTHAPLAKQALAAGKGVLVEKPMTLEVAEAEGLVAAAKAAGKPLMVGHLLMYQPAITELKRLLDAGTIGKVFRIHQERLNHGRVRNTENVMWSFSCHDIAVLLYLMGEAPERVQAQGAAFLQPDIQDDVHLELAFASGKSAHIHAAWYWPGKQRGLRVFGETGMIVYDEGDQSLTLHRKHLKGGEGADALAPVDGGVERIYEGHGEPLRLEDQHFLDALEGRCAPLSDGPSGVDVIRVLETAHHHLMNPELETAR